MVYLFKTIIIFTGFLIFCYINRDKALKDYKEKPKNGWDNPNIFQICTLKHSNSEI